MVKDPNEYAKEEKSTRLKTEKPRADEPLHVKDGDVDTEEPVKEFKAKLNKYGFLHVPKKAVQSLPFKIEKPLKARIEGKNLIIAAATKQST